MGKYVDVKMTVWERVYIDEDSDSKELIDLIKDPSMSSEEKYYQIVQNSLNSEILYDTGEIMETSENGNQATIEMYEDDTIQISI